MGRTGPEICDLSILPPFFFLDEELEAAAGALADFVLSGRESSGGGKHTRQTRAARAHYPRASGRLTVLSPSLHLLVHLPSLRLIGEHKSDVGLL